ncbi:MULTISPECIES: phage tail protein I [Brenneria]|uniref:Phage tail protein I n=1 Tax=Brenneria nigrifluens DSM 30175 = ATCC 13028 TaxID=1121120 RepID=A0A2U1UQQ0_9GAMM|nr:MULTISPECIES: phage tail protein I [Brenneria]EHD23645.1 phage tail protein I [Brenneria sp. EniD312]PWC23902.1 phage tail protein I [Brenneria nigrifluens] [Brenneria nigrifluens DSM 30175 = ATCC 13028]QCR06573.1 phage tail protein I [Brenneria nigrifluens] [Brenneria nigrifluens DSM 30175 = ATCC 13028]
MNNSLLPPSSSDFMRRVTQTAEVLSGLAVDINTLWNADKCPIDLLPYLAWALSVDRWDKNWSEQTKRQVIKAAWMVHRKKGTITALRRAIEPFGFTVRVIEWFQNGGEPGTFLLDVGVNDQGITGELYWELERLIEQAKPCSRHLTGLSVSLDVKGEAYAAAAGYLGDELTVYPYMPEMISVTGKSYSSAGIHIIDNMSVTA